MPQNLFWWWLVSARLSRSIVQVHVLGLALYSGPTLYWEGANSRLVSGFCGSLRKEFRARAGAGHFTSRHVTSGPEAAPARSHSHECQQHNTLPRMRRSEAQCQQLNDTDNTDSYTRHRPDEHWALGNGGACRREERRGGDVRRDRTLECWVQSCKCGMFVLCSVLWWFDATWWVTPKTTSVSRFFYFLVGVKTVNHLIG